MIFDEETNKKIKALGLNTYEVKIWTALLSRGVSTAGELSDIANVPRSRSYDVLESLEKKGFVVMKLGKPIKYLAVPPKEVLERVKEKIEAKTKKHMSEISHPNFNNIINHLQDMYDKKGASAERGVAVIKGKRNIQKHLEFLFKNAKREILVSSGTEAESHSEVLSDLKNKNKNVNVKIVSSKTITDDQKLDFINKKTNARMCLVDDHDLVILPLKEEETHPDYDLGIWMRDKRTNNFLKALLQSP